MNPLVLLMGLLLLAYVGSFLVGGHSIRGFGLPSGTEYVVLGFVLGPNVTGLVERSMLGTFDPIADVAVGWVALLVGFGFGVDDGRRARAGSMALGTFFAALTGGAVFGTLWLVTGAIAHLRGAALFAALPTTTSGAEGLTLTERLLLVGGIAAALSETTHKAVQWVTERHGARGPVATLLGELSQCDDLLPILGVATLFALSTPAHMPWAVTPWVWLATTLGFGVVLGALAALLLGRELRRNECWGLLVGLSVLGIGVTVRLGLSSIGTMFMMGLTTSVLSRHRAALREMVAPTDRPVLHPALVLAGAHLELHAAGGLAFLLLFAIAARMTAKAFSGLLLGAVSKPARAAGPSLGLGLLSSGAMSMTIGLAFALRFPGAIGDTVLGAAAACTVFGEFVGPRSLRAALTSAGEIGDGSPAPEAAAPAEVQST